MANREILGNILSDQYWLLDEFYLEKIELNLMGYDEIINKSVTKGGIVSKDGKIPGIRLDSLLMGPKEKNDICETCQQKYVICRGHFGHIDFNLSGSSEVAVFNPNIEILKTLVNLLNSICFECNKIICDYKSHEDKLKALKPHLRIKELAEMSSKYLICPHSNSDGSRCNTAKSKISSTDATQSKVIVDSKSKIYSAFTIFKKLSAVSKEELDFLGFKNNVKPENFIIRAIPVLPNQLRPDVYAGANLKSDPITDIYANILKLLNTQGIQDLPRKLQDCINNLFDTIDEKIKGKRGMIRGEMLGKRMNFCGRTPINTDGSLKAGEITIPLKMAKSITYTDTVTEQNKAFILKLFDESKIMTHIPCSGENKNIEKIVDSRYLQTLGKIDNDIEYINIEIGDKVKRHLQDGDIAIINRQPTLTKRSMMAHTIKIQDIETINIPVCVTTPYNADFDGDEYNIHFPQSAEAQLEAQQLMHIKNNMVNNETGQMTFGQVLDAVTGAFMITEDIDINEDIFEACNSVITAPKDLDLFYKRLNEASCPKTSGMALYSLILPDTLNFADDNIIISKGILTSGQIKGKQIKRGHTSLTKFIWENYGEDVCMDFITNGSVVVNKYFEYKPFTVSLKDFPNQKPLNTIQQLDKAKTLPDRQTLLLTIKDDFNDTGLEIIRTIIIDGNDTKYNSLKDNLLTMKEYKDKEMKKLKTKIEALGAPPKDPNELVFYENKIKEMTNTLTHFSEKFTKKFIQADNNFLKMVKSGGKGDSDNLVKAIALIGQQNFKGERIKAEMKGNRSTSANKPGQCDIESRGFVTESYYEGLSPLSLFFHATASREGTIDTGIGVSLIGYMQRKMMKSFEDIRIDNKFGVSNNYGKIIQFCYGGDGYDTTSVKNVKGIYTPVDVKSVFDKLNFN